MASFMRYVPKEVVINLLLNKVPCEILMSPLSCTILFMDIVSFTTICSLHHPAVVSVLIEVYFRTMSGIIMSHHGVIDKFIGDCIMAVWGAPFDCQFAEVKCILACLLMIREMQTESELKRIWDAKNVKLGARIGVNSGEVHAGNMGTAKRMAYTVVGDPVNLAARLESGAKQFGLGFLVSGDTVEACAKYFAFRALIPLVVVGRTTPVVVYQCMGLNAAALTKEEDFDTDVPHQTELTEDDHLTAPTMAPTATTEVELELSELEKPPSLIRAAPTRSRRGTLALTPPQSQLEKLPSLIRAALGLQNPSVTATDSVIHFCDRYTDLLRTTYLKDRNFQGVLDGIKDLSNTYQDHPTIKALLSESDVEGQEKDNKNKANEATDMLRRECRRFLASPPSADWNGAYVATEK